VVCKRFKDLRESGTQVMHHFVNGGGGAYLSIGTAVDFPKAPAVDGWAFYPRTDRLRAKMDAETPMWKQPFWYWIRWLNAWPFNVETLSGVFDFNVRPSSRASWKYGSNDPDGAWSSSLTAPTARCSGATCR
jgi:hypothetical protein